MEEYEDLNSRHRLTYHIYYNPRLLRAIIRRFFSACGKISHFYCIFAHRIANCTSTIISSIIAFGLHQLYRKVNHLTNSFMKRITRIVIAISIFLSAACNLQAKNKDTQIYAFATGMCFNDSTTFISAILPIPNAQTDHKTGFLNYRSEYSNQFKRYLETSENGPFTCAVFFAKSKKSLEKKYIKLRNLYKMKNQSKFVEVPINKFKFIQTADFEY